MKETSILAPDAGDTGAVAADPVTRFLSARGFETSVAYLGESEFELGMRLTWKGMDVIYRYESGCLLICDIGALSVPEGLDGAVRRLVAFIRAVERSVPEVQLVVGHVPLEGADPALNEMRARLLSVYLHLGAQRMDGDIAGMEKVVYRVRSSTALPCRGAMETGPGDGLKDTVSVWVAADESRS